MSTKLQEYKRARHPTGHKNIHARKTTKLSFHAWLLPKHYHRHASRGPHATYAHNLINDINVPASKAVAEALSHS
jgi:hypothetical protein